MNDADKDKREEKLIGQMLMLSVIARLVSTYPQDDDLAWLQSIIDEDLLLDIPYGTEQRDTMRGAGLLAKGLTPSLTNRALQEMQTDYVRLFIGPGRVLAPPWESVYFSEDRLVFQEQTLQVRNWYRRFGLEPEKLHKEPDDHIGLEISFVAYLARLAFEALAEQDEEEFEQLLEAQRQFLSEHLLKWGPYWCDLVLEHAQTEFYQGLALLTRGALLAMAQQFDIRASREIIG